ncbi:MAG: excinuclease ABC subunit UvrC [Myxococcales bacterium]|nr:excinuclease ABC subunit UvrC [Myxococcales bacterium]
MDEAIQKKLDTLPSSPGVYLFRDRQGEVLYVGKAASLKSRVRSYFQPGTGDERYFIERLQYELGDLETFVATSEKEAALLENSLIKEHQPRYNVKLRDDKDFLSLRLDESAAWPRLEVVRRPKKDGARYFGPYHSATAARSTLRLVNRHFQLRTCTDAELSSRTRPCLQYQIKRCPGPCVIDVSEREYREQVKSVGLFLEGRHDELKVHLQHGMETAAGDLRYELAATYRDQLRAVESTQQAQRVSLVTNVDQDVFGYLRKEDKAEVAVLLARRGRVVGVRTFELKDVQLPDDELVASFVGAYYDRSSYVPHELLIATPIEAAEGLEALLSEQRGSRVRILRPQRGNKAQLLRMAMENAAHAFREKARASEDRAARLEQIRQKLDLREAPERIECIDVSHLGGKDTAAAIVAFTGGEPDRKRYRSFHVRNVSGGDDYGAMHEVLQRRFRRAQSGDPDWALPHLLVVDGGKGQLGIALSALESIGVSGLAVAALAKEKETALGERVVDRVYLPGRMNPIELKRAGPGLQILAHARDEAHRASNLLREKLGRRKKLQSGLDAVPGVGRKTRAALLKALGSMKAVESADEEALVDAGATRKQARAITAHFSETPAESDSSEEQAVDNAFSS